MKNLAIIPARGGSKRIPRKNIRVFMGKPIIVYSIKAALESRLFDKVMVSTDDAEIANIAREHGAEVPFMRSLETANDYAGLTDVFLEVLIEYEKMGIVYDNFCCILPTAPLISPDSLLDSWNVLQNSDFDSVYPVVPFSYPVQRSVILTADHEIKMTWPEYSDARSQDLEPMYHDAGTFYWVKTRELLKEKTFDTLKCGGIIVDELHVQDIDNEVDWQLAILKYQLIHGRK